MLRSMLASLALAPLLVSTASARAPQLSPRADDDPDKVIEDSELLSLHRDLCNIESISSNEAEVGEFIIEYLEKNDFTTKKQEVDADEDAEGDSEPRFNVFAYPKGGKETEVDVLLTTHMDTVPPHIPYKASAN